MTNTSIFGNLKKIKIPPCALSEILIQYHHQQQMELRHMKTKLNSTMTHNACYAVRPSCDVVYLLGWDLHTECGKYYIRLYRDNSSGKSFYTVRDASWDLARRIYSVGFCSEENALLDIRRFVSSYTKDDVVISTIPLRLKECA